MTQIRIGSRVRHAITKGLLGTCGDLFIEQGVAWAVIRWDTGTKETLADPEVLLPADAVEEVDRLRAENMVMRAALEVLEDGACGASYGPGCDARCKGVAWKALDALKESEGREP